MLDETLLADAHQWLLRKYNLQHRSIERTQFLKSHSQEREKLAARIAPPHEDCWLPKRWGSDDGRDFSDQVLLLEHGESVFDSSSTGCGSQDTLPHETDIRRRSSPPPWRLWLMGGRKWWVGLNSNSKQFIFIIISPSPPFTFLFNMRQSEFAIHAHSSKGKYHTSFFVHLNSLTATAFPPTPSSAEEGMGLKVHSLASLFFHTQNL